MERLFEVGVRELFCCDDACVRGRWAANTKKILPDDDFEFCGRTFGKELSSLLPFAAYCTKLFVQ